MPKLNAVLMALLAVAVIAAMGFLTLRPAPAQEIQPAQVQKLLRKLADPDPDVRREGEAGLRQAGAASIAPLREAAQSSDRVLADRASKLLRELQPSSAHPTGATEGKPAPAPSAASPSGTLAKPSPEAE